MVDHINGNPHDNKISNLRVISIAENARNRKKPKNNTSNLVGIHWMVTKNDKRAVARWTDLSGIRLSKSFSVNKYGEALALELARECRELEIFKLNAQGANYTERHGT